MLKTVRLGVAGLTLAVAFACLTGTAHATLYGIHQDLLHSHTLDRGLHITKARDVLHARVSRSAIHWSGMEPNQGQINWAVTDDIVNRLEAAKIQPVFSIVAAPAWANGSSNGCTVPTDQAAFDAFKAHYAAFAAQIVARYKGRVRYWEVWNEPNEEWCWKPRPTSGNAYAELFKAAYPAMKAADPGARVATGGVAALNGGATGVTGKQFLRDLFDAGVTPDAVAIHPYPSSNRDPDDHDPKLNNFDDVEMIRDILVEKGRGSIPLWVTEWGWSTYAVGRERQAANVKRSLEIIRDEWSGFVQLATYFIDKDRTIPGKQGYDQGLLDLDFQPKLAAGEFARFMDSLPPQPEETTPGGGDVVGPDVPGGGGPPGAGGGGGNGSGTGSTSARTRTCRVRVRSTRLRSYRVRGVQCATVRRVLGRYLLKRRLPAGWRCTKRSANRGTCRRGKVRFTWSLAPTKRSKPGRRR